MCGVTWLKNKVSKKSFDWREIEWRVCFVNLMEINAVV
jgi:hypothetical protein